MFEICFLFIALGKVNLFLKNKIGEGERVSAIKRHFTRNYPKTIKTENKHLQNNTTSYKGY